MIVIIRIAGMVKKRQESKETLSRLRLKRKYSCVLIDEKDPIRVGMLNKSKDFVAYGKIDEQMLTRLVEKRGKMIDKSKKISVDEAIKGIKEGKKMEELNLKPYFRLHPPRGGLRSSKMRFPKGVLGNHKEKINLLIERML